jgi:uncharacterized repeat protein (TIGR03803 family)
MRIAMLVLCGALVAGCARTSGVPSLPSTSPAVTDTAPKADSYGQYVSLYSFRGEGSGGSPQAGLVEHNGELYGTTSAYGNGYGTVFKVDALGRVSTVYSFSGYPDGAYPEAGLVWYKDAFYGTTSAGGTQGGGTVFAVTPSGAERVIHDFEKGRDGAQPESGLVEYGGVLYGTTQNGGTRNTGTVFELTPNGVEHVMHSFIGAPSDGGHPTAGLTLVGSEFYGVTRAGGKIAAGGCAFKINLFGQVKVLHSFKVEPGDGYNPAGTLVAIDGILYGTTLHGGDIGQGYGTVFEMDTRGVEGVIHSFGGANDGAFPAAGLTSVQGNLYGTTTGGGTSPRKSNECISSGVRINRAGYYKCGTIFSITKAGRERVVYRFRGDPDGANPEAALTLAGGVLYGTTDWGGDSSYYGTIFRIFP